VLQGKLINLRPIIRDDLDLLQRWVNDPEIVSRFNFFGYRSSEAIQNQFERSGCLSEEAGRLMIVLKNDTPIGDVSYHEVHNGPNIASICYNIGIFLIPEARGKGYGVEAQQLLCHYLFNHSQIERIEASTDVENLPEQHALEKAGFTREGIMRHAQFREGTWHDLVLYSRLRND
jgi:RimJ/RimL family protein N-acetyltransferase